MSVVPASAFPTIFVSGPIPPIPEDTTYQNVELAYQLTSDLANSPSPVVLDAFMDEHPHFYLNSVGRCSWSAMAVAIDKQALPLIRAILQREPSIANAPEAYLLDALSPEMIKIFLEHGADINQHRYTFYHGQGITPLHAAIQQRNDNSTKFLLLRGGIVYEEAWKRIVSRKTSVADTYDPAYVKGIIQQIQKEYSGSGDGLTRNLHSSRSHSVLSRLPQEIRPLVTQFLNHETSLMGRFLTKLQLVRE